MLTPPNPLDHLGLVRWVARRYLDQGLPLDDLVSEGTLGLLNACRCYDASCKTSFSTYAFYAIRNAISRALDRQVPALAVPYNVLQRMRTGVPAKTPKRAADYKSALAATQKAVGDHQLDGGTLGQVLVDHREERSPDEDREYLMALLAQLEAEEAAVLRMRFGIDGEEPKTFREIGREIGRPISTVQYIQAGAIDRLRRTAC